MSPNRIAKPASTPYSRENQSVNAVDQVTVAVACRKLKLPLIHSVSWMGSPLSWKGPLKFHFIQPTCAVTWKPSLRQPNSPKKLPSVAKLGAESKNHSSTNEGRST